MLNVGERIREIRESKGAKQTFISKKLGKSTGWLSNIESGRRKVKADDLEKIAEVLGVPISEFFKTK